MPFGLFYCWWRGDRLPALPSLAGLATEPVAAGQLLATFDGLDAASVRQRVRQGHRPYLARLDGAPAAVGWSATERAGIGELGIQFSLPAGNRYLWDFVTLPARRGLGIYPHLLQGILALEPEAERFWIGHDQPNQASARGILKAGFQLVAELYQTGDDFHFVASGPRERALAASALLGLPLAGED